MNFSEQAVGELGEAGGGKEYDQSILNKMFTWKIFLNASCTMTDPSV